MKLCYAQTGERRFYAAVAAEGLQVLSGNPLEGPARPTGECAPLSECRLLAPVKPGKIICIGKNYSDHVIELAGLLEPDQKAPPEPVLFFKPPSAVIGPGEAIVCPPASRRVDYEAEIAVVIGQRARYVSIEQWQEHVFGYTCLNDVTARDLQKSDGQWTRAKGFDTFCPLGPWIETELDVQNARVISRLNGQTRQSESAQKMIHSIGKLICYISSVMTLEVGDVIATGTPVGVGPMCPGDTIEIEVEGVGTLTNPVVSAT